MATRKPKKKKTSSKAAKTSRKKPVTKKKPAAKKKPVAKKKPASKKKSVAKKKPAVKKKGVSKKKATKATSKVSKKARGKKKAGADKLSKAEKAARRRRLNAYKRLLQSKRESLLQAYNISKSNTRIESRDGTEDYIDYAVSSYHRDFTLSLTEMDRQQLKLVEEALARLRRREYGNCQHCTAEIPEKRLEVEPWARHCIRCQELDEQGLLEPPEFEQETEEAVAEEVPEEETDIDAEDELTVEEGATPAAEGAEEADVEDPEEEDEDDIDL
jgi:RNA polymerase-binding protein DksA